MEFERKNGFRAEGKQKRNDVVQSELKHRQHLLQEDFSFSQEL
jgi:hypothetical protein